MQLTDYIDGGTKHVIIVDLQSRLTTIIFDVVNVVKINDQPPIPWQNNSKFNFMLLIC